MTLHKLIKITEAAKNISLPTIKDFYRHVLNLYLLTDDEEAASLFHRMPKNSKKNFIAQILTSLISEKEYNKEEAAIFFINQF